MDKSTLTTERESLGADGQSTRRSDASAHRLPGLDGLRAVSIALVIGYHFQMSGSLPAWTNSFFRNGSFGVEVFFTISGLLITWLLLREESAHGSISLRQFYARRAVRILPPAMGYLLIILVGSLLHGTMQWKPWTSAALFYRNLHMTDAEAVGAVDTSHFWSLSTEEQFYLIWPVLFLLLRPRARVPFLLALLCVVPVWRHVSMHQAHGSSVAVFRIDMHCDGILMGCLVACAMEDPRYRRFLSHPVFRSDLTAIACVMIVAATFAEKALRFPGQVIYPSIRAVCVALFVYRMIRRSAQNPSVLDWFLNLNVMVIVGQLSYSLYLWQQPFCMPNGSFRTHSRILDASAACACAAASFLLIERPAQLLRRKFGSRTLQSASRNAVGREISSANANQGLIH